jgi:hypothetical protein
METYRAAVIEHRGNFGILVPVDSAFGHKNEDEQQASVEALQEAAHAQGLQGDVIAVWNGGGGKIQFRAPRQWLKYCRTISLNGVENKINSEFTCENADVRSRRHLPTDAKAHYMLKRIYARCGDDKGAVCVLGAPEKSDNMTREEWHANYQYLCNQGLVQNLGSLYSTVMTPKGIELAKSLTPEIQQ